MKRRYPPFLVPDVLSAPEPGTGIRILVSRQSTSDRTVVPRSGLTGRRGIVPRVAMVPGHALGTLSIWIACVLVLFSVPGAFSAPASAEARPSVGAPIIPLGVSRTPPTIDAPPASVPVAGPVLALVESVEVDGEGIFLDQIVSRSPEAPLPHVRLAPAPSVGQSVLLSRTQVVAWIQTKASALDATRWSGPDRSKITRRTRSLDESEVRSLLQATLQREQVKDRGELELRLNRPWSRIAIADEPLELKVVDLPATGPSANFIVRFEIWAGPERLGSWQIAASAKVWREILVAESPLKRGQLLRTAPLVRERRDVLALRDAAIVDLVEDGAPGETELKENVGAGQPVLARSIRVRPAVFRGSIVDGLILDGSMTINLKVEVLEDGLPGHVVRVRNPRTRREMLGKVQNERTILIPL